MPILRTITQENKEKGRQVLGELYKRYRVGESEEERRNFLKWHLGIINNPSLQSLERNYLINNTNLYDSRLVTSEDLNRSRD